MKIVDYANKKLKEYMVYDNYRSIASYIDGFKPSTRKLIWNSGKYKSFSKVDMIANATAGKSQYLHGAVNLEGVLKGACNDYAGTNLISLFDKEGFFGTRTEPEPGASRYIKAKEKSLMNLLYKSEDEPILIKQEFEGYEIEPKFYVPILPTILINGSEGIGNGFSHNIATYKPSEISEQIFNILDNKNIGSLLPYYSEFKGEISQDKDKNNRFIIKGVIEVLNTTTVIVNELPPGYKLSKYIKILDILEENRIIKSYKDKSNRNKFLFEIKCPRSTTALSNQELLKIFKLETSVSNNLTLIDENNSIKVFNNTLEVLNEYIKIRLEYYVKRKEYLIQKMKSDITILENRIKFINDILNDIIIFKGNKKVQIEKQLKDLKYHKDESYDYLLNMNIHSLTEDKIKDLENKLNKLNKELSDYLNKDITMIWKEEINELLVALGEKKLRMNQSKLDDIDIKPISNNDDQTKSKEILLDTPEGKDILLDTIEKVNKDIETAFVLPKELLNEVEIDDLF